MATLTATEPLTSADVERRIPDWRVRPNTAKVARTVADEEHTRRALLAARTTARDAREAAEREAAKLDADGADAGLQIAALRRVSDARIAEAEALAALAAYTPATETGGADLVRDEQAATAAELAALNAKVGDPLVTLVQAVLVQVQSLNAVNMVCDGYFRHGEGGDPTGTPVSGVRAYLAPGTRLYPGVDGQVVKQLEFWLRRARGERF